MTAGRPHACDTCLRRAWLIASLTGHIEKAVEDTPGNRAHELLALADGELARALAGSKAADFLRRAAERDPDGLRAAVAGAAAWTCCRHDELFPEPLAELGDPPALLFGRGETALLGALRPNDAVTIVGSRRASRYGRELARELGAQVAAAGMAVVSGMAMGIDSSAHTGALEAGGLTIAVLGSGVDVPYPARSARLYEEIVERGLVLGELPPGAPARRWTFPARNRIMAALGSMTVVVEARERSGSLITASMAEQLNREVGAVPGQVGASAAAGTNALVHDGAHLIRNGRDVLDVLLGPGMSEQRAPVPRGPELESDLAEVLDLVERGSTSADALARTSRLAPGPLATALLRLELVGYLRSSTGGRYERTSLAPPEPAQLRH